MLICLYYATIFNCNNNVTEIERLLEIIMFVYFTSGFFVNICSDSGMLPDDIKSLQNQRWLIINMVPWHSSEDNSTGHVEDINQ